MVHERTVGYVTIACTGLTGYDAMSAVKGDHVIYLTYCLVLCMSYSHIRLFHYGTIVTISPSLSCAALQW